MRISLAQIQPAKGDIEYNLALHQEFVERAIEQRCNLVVFPELSLTGYEPSLAKALASSIQPEMVTVFNKMAKDHGITIVIGLPIITSNKVRISLAIFQPTDSTVFYSKQLLHIDETPFFAPGDSPGIFSAHSKLIAPAICYESLQPQHLNHASHSGVQLYLVSAAKPKKGVDEAYRYFPRVAKANSLPIAMVNSVGYCDNFLCEGQSAVWDQDGQILGCLNESQEGLLVCDLT